MIRSSLRLATRLTTSPSYVFGRFRSVRRAYGVGQSVLRSNKTSLQAVQLHHSSGDPIARGPSGLLESTRSTREHCAALDATAWSDGIRLTGDALAALRDFAHHSPLAFRRGPDQFDGAAALAELSAEDRAGITTATLVEAWRSPLVRRLAGDPLLTDVVSTYLGYPPRLAMPYFFWSFAGDIGVEERVARNQTVLFHYDVQGYNFAYVSFYLYDTSTANGAHVLVEGSHREKRLGHLFGSARISDEQAAATYGPDRIVTIEAKAGEGFFEDTSCFHKALPPRDGDRLMLQVRYL